MPTTRLILGDCVERLRGLSDCSVDAVVTDPPYGLSFMGKKWDYDVPGEDVWRECLRVLKPGGHLLAFAGTRTQHRMAVRIEDAGFEIRDMIAWVYGSGFPKSLDVSKAIDKAAGAEREVTKRHIQSATRPDEHAGASAHITMPNSWNITAPATPEAQQWVGWGTALKPALEPITVARKPLDGTVAENVLEHGTGALNIDGCRVETADKLRGGSESAQTAGKIHEGWQRPWMNDAEAAERFAERRRAKAAISEELGRWPANLIHDGSDEVVGLFPETDKAPLPREGGFRGNDAQRGTVDFKSGCKPTLPVVRGDTGSAARFFYCAKASKADRDEGCEGLKANRGGSLNMRTDSHSQANGMDTGPRRNHHPTVKPTDLMRYLCRLVTPPGGIVLDPFMGSGSTGKAAVLEGFGFIGIEREEEYLEIAKARIGAADPLFQLTASV